MPSGCDIMATFSLINELSKRTCKTTWIELSKILAVPRIATSRNVQYCTVSRRSRINSLQPLGLASFKSSTSLLILQPSTGKSRSTRYIERFLGTMLCSKRFCAHGTYSSLSPLLYSSGWSLKKTFKEFAGRLRQAE